MALLTISGNSLPSGDYQPNWTILIEQLEQLGHQVTYDGLGDVFIALDHCPRGFKRFHGECPRAPKILIRQETDSVYPLQYTKRVVDKYDLVLTLGHVPDNDSVAKFFGHCYKPYPNPAVPTESKTFEQVFKNISEKNAFKYHEWAKRRYLVTFVGGNKIGLGKSRNYQLRSKLVSELLGQGLIVFGPFWNTGLWDRFSNRFRTLLWGLRTNQLQNLLGIFNGILKKYPGALGIIEDKFEVLRESKFTLVIENSDYFVTEKIFDSMLAGCIPIYKGPDLKRVGIPEGLVIPFDRNIDDLTEYLSQIPEIQIDGRLSQIESYLGSENFKYNWLAESVFANVASEIDALISSSSGRLYGSVNNKKETVAE